MNTINRLEETWSPSWDLGLQQEFGFGSDAALAEPSLKTERPSPWAMASREVLNRQVSTSARSSQRGKFVNFLEALSMEIANDE